VNTYDSAVIGCVFIDNKMDRAFTINVASGQMLLISDCVFSGTQENEIKDERVTVDNCLFSQRQFPEISFLSFAGNQVPGFDRARTVVVKAVPGTTQAQLAILQYFGKNRKMAVVGASCAIAGILAIVITALQVAIRRIWTAKVPKAFQ
jgi:hypothetical protein